MLVFASVARFTFVSLAVFGFLKKEPLPLSLIFADSHIELCIRANKYDESSCMLSY